MNERIKACLVWLSRIGHCRGFGVQSPSAYRFIRYVINEHYPYYAYDDMRKAMPDVSWLTRRRMELYFRVVNHLQPSLLYDNGSDDMSLFTKYVTAASSKVRIMSSDDVPEKMENIDLARITPGDNLDTVLSAVLQRSHDNMVIMIEGIVEDSRAREAWRRLVHSDKTSVCYDLYYLGIAFCDTKRLKDCHIVNF